MNKEWEIIEINKNIIIEEDSTIIRAKIVRQYKAIIFNETTQHNII